MKINWLTSTLVEKNQAGVINMNKIINFLTLNEKYTFNQVASILAMFMIIILVIHSLHGHSVFLGHLFCLFGVYHYYISNCNSAHYIPKLSIVSFMIDIHEANQDQDEQLEDQEPYFFDTSKLLSFPKKLAALIKS